MNVAIWWIRRDLRLNDNQALDAALKAANFIIPIFVLDPKLIKSAWVGEKRLAFLYSGLRALDKDLRARGASLLIRHGDPEVVLAQLVHETGAERVFAEADVSPFANTRDQRVAQSVPLTLTPGLTAYLPESLLKSDGNPYTIFTPFCKTWLSHPDLENPTIAPHHISMPVGVQGEDIPDQPRLPDTIPFVAGEGEGLRRLDIFTEGLLAPVYDYASNRDRMDLEGTSGLSPYLRFGMVSARQAIMAARDAETGLPINGSGRGASIWLTELIWREFYLYILKLFPSVRFHSFRSALRQIAWRNDREEFAAWSEGCTGYPIVDAAMRQLNQTGWMHNRARMIVASFLTKDLLVDWRWGERYFMQHLIDGDVASNNGGWQWTAGTGTDAAPYFRVFNPVLQGKKFDPMGIYIRRNVPELVYVPNEFIHEPWKMPDSIQKQTACLIGNKYPAPMVDHRLARERALFAYKTGVK
jgi:deoxyribodipyrimidine photo-lyase